MGVDFSEVDRATERFMRQQAEDWVEQQNILYGIHCGFWCIKCRAPFVDYKLFVECNCPPLPLRENFIYA